MPGWEIALAVLGGLASVEAARRTVWRAGKALVLFGDALPEVARFPAVVVELREEVRGVRTDLRDHMDIEDGIQLSVEKVLANFVVRQRNVEIGNDRVAHELANLQQVVMNGLKLGDGDRWRLAQQEVILEPVPPEDSATDA